MDNEVIVRFDKVSFEYEKKHILNGVDFNIRKNIKMALMGQNGAGKTTIFNLISKTLKPNSGEIHIKKDISIATAFQVIPQKDMELTLRDFFQNCFKEKIYDIDPKIDNVLKIVNLEASYDKKINSFSGGQQARILLAAALIQDPDLLLLDEPTNNLDKIGIEHLTDFLIKYNKTCIVISHDADFLNSFTNGVLYLDSFNHKVEKYTGNYHDVVREISAKIKKENMKNAQLDKKIIEKKEKSNFFKDKGGNLRMVAKKMRQLAEELEEQKVVIRREDKTIRPFIIPLQENISGEIIHISSFTIIKKDKNIIKKANISLRKNEHLLLSGPNGIGKTTLLESIVNKSNKDITIASGTKIGYYRQDFSNLNFENTVMQSLIDSIGDFSQKDLRSTAAGFLINDEIIKSKIGDLSEGQKGLVALANLVLQKPGLLILDEPTNHINFRHLPIIASALDKYEGPMILVSHVKDFVDKIRIDKILELDKE
ncbi:MAG: ATP-binding cassette domain-containing protein [Candidatus Pacebacteria bacterium]|nr:ATP-binding cassette domain-containing protein [Candidatus Paceibacterota bacterium]